MTALWIIVLCGDQYCSRSFGFLSSCLAIAHCVRNQSTQSLALPLHNPATARWYFGPNSHVEQSYPLLRESFMHVPFRITEKIHRRVYVSSSDSRWDLCHIQKFRQNDWPPRMHSTPLPTHDPTGPSIYRPKSLAPLLRIRMLKHKATCSLPICINSRHTKLNLSKNRL